MLNSYSERLDSRLEIRHLRYFVAVAESLHFGRAAKRLGIAQPPLSQQIKRLEEILGVPLFERSSRRVSLTDAGAALLEESRNVFRALETASTRAKRAAAGEVGTLRVTFADSIMFQGLPGIIRAFHRDYPNVRLVLEELSSGAQLRALQAGDLDVGFIRNPEPDPSLRTEVVLTEPLLVALAASHPLAGEGPDIRLGDLTGEDFVLFPREVAPGLFDQIIGLCRDVGFAPRVAQESRELPTTVSLVEAGIGISILPAAISRVEWSGVAYRSVQEGPVFTQIHMTARADNQRPVVEAFWNTAKKVVAEMADRS